MADDLADYPIVVLENDYPEQVGKVGLFDFLMPVGNTGIVFTAAVPGRLYKWGPTFTDTVKAVSRLRAASTLAQMGLVNGATVAFLRVALQLTQAELATSLGVALADVQDWETNVSEIPRLMWDEISRRVGVADGRPLPSVVACPQNFRPRKIRVFPNIPMGAQPQPTNPSVTSTNGCSPPDNAVTLDCIPLT